MSAEQRLVRFLQRVEESNDILLSNKRRLKEFIEARRAKGNAHNTCIKYLYPLYQMNALGWVTKPFEKLTKDDMQKIVIKSENTKWSAKTKKNLRVALKVFYKWLEGEEKFAPNEYPIRVKFISTTIPKRERKELEFIDIVSKDEVTKLAQYATNSIQKALLWTAYESGGRPEEIFNMKKSDIIFDTFGAKIFLKGAKSKRPVRLVAAAEPLRDWLRKHPLAKEKDFFVWVTQFSKKNRNGNKWTQMSDPAANRILKQLAEKVGIEKRITMYSLRRGRATELAANPRIPRSVLHKVMGWEEGSTISRSYVKLNDETVDEAMLSANGISVSKKEPENFIECTYCGARNTPSALNCESTECGKPLLIGIQKDMGKMVRALRGGKHELVKTILEDEEFADELLKRLSERKAEKSLADAIQKTTGY